MQYYAHNLSRVHAFLVVLPPAAPAFSPSPSSNEQRVASSPKKSVLIDCDTQTGRLPSDRGKPVFQQFSLVAWIRIGQAQDRFISVHQQVSRKGGGA